MTRRENVRFNRRILATAAFALAVSLSACSTASEDPATNEDTDVTTSASTEADQSQSVPLPGAPSGEWTVAGDLCKMITDSVAAGILGHEGTLTTEFDPEDLPAQAGIDACRYTDYNAPKGLTVLLSVRSGVTDEVWAQTESEFDAQKGTYELTEYGADGVDDVLANSSQQVIVRKGEIMVSALNSSLGKFNQQSLVALTALVANMNVG
jgi:hypothetical protein